MRRIDYLELCQLVSKKQDFSLRWCDRYYRMIRLYRGKIQLIRDQINLLWGDEWELPPELDAQVQLLEIELEHYKHKLERCRTRHSVLIRYGQYFGQLPFRLLDKNGSIPDCFWYRTPTSAAEKETV